MNCFHKVVSGQRGHFARLFNPKTIFIKGTFFPNIKTKRCSIVFHPIRKLHTEDEQGLKHLLGDLSEKTISKRSTENEVALKASYMTADLLFRNFSSMFPFYKDVKIEQNELAKSIFGKCQGLKPLEVLDALEDGTFSGLMGKTFLFYSPK